jgi:hypothetical protein
VAPPTTQTQAAQDPPPRLPVDLSRIKNGLETSILVRIDDGKIRFYAETVAPSGPTFKELTVNFDLRAGPVPGSGMTHSDFLSMVTPKDLYGSGGIRPLETLQWGLVNHVGWWAIRKLYKELNETVDERRKQAIRDQIDRELAALRGKK